MLTPLRFTELAIVPEPAAVPPLSLSSPPQPLRTVSTLPVSTNATSRDRCGRRKFMLSLSTDGMSLQSPRGEHFLGDTRDVVDREREYSGHHTAGDGDRPLVLDDPL